jgi:hypothetical protein
MYLQEVNKLKMELGSSKNEISTLKELSLHAPEPSHLDEVLSFLFVNLSLPLEMQGTVRKSQLLIWFSHPMVVYILDHRRG